MNSKSRRWLQSKTSTGSSTGQWCPLPVIWGSLDGEPKCGIHHGFTWTAKATKLRRTRPNISVGCLVCSVVHEKKPVISQVIPVTTSHSVHSCSKRSSMRPVGAPAWSNRMVTAMTSTSDGPGLLFGILVFNSRSYRRGEENQGKTQKAIITKPLDRYPNTPCMECLITLGSLGWFLSSM